MNRAAPAADTSLSVIIPAWNEGALLVECLDALRKLRGIAEIIVADASDTDESQTAARDAGALAVACSRPNRGVQMNAGAACASGSVFLFFHADSILTQPHLDSLRTTMCDAAIIGGAFHRKFDERHARLRWIEPIARWLNSTGGSLYGDQSIFVRRETFAALGGYAAIPLLEDVEFSRRLRRAGRIALLDPPMQSSPRKHARQGAWRTTIENGCLILLYKLGASPHSLHRWYYRQRAAIS